MVNWNPMTNTQRTAKSKFADWEVVPNRADVICTRADHVVHGVVCRFLQPVGRPEEARWVPIEQIEADPQPEIE